MLDKLLEFTIASDYCAGRKAQKKILDEVAKNGFNSHSAFAIKLALEEAMVNAIKHGNKGETGKHVRIQARISPGHIELTVEDEGEGFERKTVPDPTRTENLQKCSGRGILLMESYMDDVRWEQGGRRVVMTKNNFQDVLPRKR